MTLKLIKIYHLQIEVLSYMNACEWIWKMTAYLKDKDFWTPIKTVLEEWRAQKSGKMLEPASEPAETAKASKKAGDSTTERSILAHWALTEKQLKDHVH